MAPFSDEVEQRRRQYLQEQEARNKKIEREFPGLVEARLRTAIDAAIVQATSNYVTKGTGQAPGFVVYGDIARWIEGRGSYEAGTEVIKNVVLPKIRLSYPDWDIIWLKRESGPDDIPVNFVVRRK